MGGTAMKRPTCKIIRAILATHVPARFSTCWMAARVGGARGKVTTALHYLWHRQELERIQRGTRKDSAMWEIKRETNEPKPEQLSLSL